jgi:hypothetical protein
MKNLIFVFAVTLVFFSCKQKRDLPSFFIDYEYLDTTEFFSPNIFKSPVAIYLDTNGKIFSQWLYLKIKNNKFYFLDKEQSAVLVFENTGKLVNKINKRGRGPGEYQFIKDLNISDNGNIELLCDASPKVIRYSPYGDLLSETKLKFQAFAFISQGGDSYLFFKGRMNDSLLNNNTIIRTDNNFNYRESFFPMKESFLAGFSEMNFSASEGKSVLFKHLYDKCIYKIYKDTALIPEYQINFGKKGYPEEFLKARSYSEAYDIITKITTASVYSAFDNKDYLVGYIVEEGIENNVAYLLLNKRTGNIAFQRFSIKHDIVNCLGAPLALTDNNEIVFAADPELLGSVADKYPLISGLDRNRLKPGTGYVLLKFEIQ